MVSITSLIVCSLLQIGRKRHLKIHGLKSLPMKYFLLLIKERFSVLYSDKASRLNTSVNIIAGALINKELFDYSDDEIVENLMFDLHLQYALHATSFAEQSLSDKSLSRFRNRCYAYETAHGVDIFYDCVKDLSAKIANLMSLSDCIKRMDSMMIESNIRFLSCMELIYKCISKLVFYLKKNVPDKVIELLDTMLIPMITIEFFITKEMMIWHR